MPKITITEGLAEIKTVLARIEKKKQFVQDHLFLQGQFKDPLHEEGGTSSAIKAARQSIRDLSDRIVQIRSAINGANRENSITVDGETRTIADWIIWKREISSKTSSFLEVLRNKIANTRAQAAQKQIAVTDKESQSDKEITVFVKELELANEIEHHEKVMGELDGQLSLKNATITIEI